MANYNPKTYDVRILLKNATDAQWSQVEETFIPLKGEMVLFDDGKWKIGNGSTVLKDLPFYYGDKDTHLTYEFSVDQSKPATLIVTAKDDKGAQIGEAQEVVIPGIAAGGDLGDIEDRIDKVEETLENLASLKPLNYRGIHAAAIGEDGAISVADIADPAEADVILDAATGKEYVYDGEKWVEIGDENSYLTEEAADAKYVIKEEGKGLSSNDFNDELKQKLESIDLSKYVLKEEGKGLSTNDLTNEYKATLDNALDKLDTIAEGATKVEISGLADNGQNVATITINGVPYVIKAPLADEIDVPAYISDLAGSVKPNNAEGYTDVVFSCGGAPKD